MAEMELLYERAEREPTAENVGQTEREIDNLEHILKWLDALEHALEQNRGADLLLNMLAQYGLGDVADSDELDQSRPEWPHLRAQLMAYNKAVWELLQAFDRTADVAAAVVRALRRSNDTRVSDTDWQWQDHYRILLEHFLVPNPNPNWVGEM